MPGDVEQITAPEPVESSLPGGDGEVAEVETAEVETETPESTEVAGGQETPEQGEEDHLRESSEEEELTEWRGTASARLRELAKTSPDLAKAMRENPKLANTLSATFRREAAYRELFPTVAEAKELRETFPRGMEDAKVLLADVQQLGQIDQLFDSNNPQSHEKLLRQMAERNSPAFKSFARTLPKVWAQIDPEGYQSTLRGIIGTTLESEGLPGFAQKLVAAARTSGDKNLETMAGELSQWLTGFSEDSRRKPDPRQEELDRRARELDQREQSTAQKNAQEYQSRWNPAEIKQERDMIKADRAIARLYKAVPQAKADRIVEDIRVRTASYLMRSVSFRNAFGKAYAEGLEPALAMTKAAWQRSVGMFIRRVLAEETPMIVKGNRADVNKREQAAQRRDAGSGAAPVGPKKPAALDRKSLSNMSMKERLQALAQKRA
jgi:hypothetical protein